MASINEIWGGLQQRAKVGIGAGAVLILGLTIGLGIWAYRPDYQVLFADVPSRDAAAMTAELDRMKVPYQLDDNGNTILVPKDLVYKTRLKLMGKDIPLHGAVGFEVFNNADFGMTEFVQKVNYQRAIQGELTRTIQSIDDVQSARVHLAIPEQGLFKKATTKPKASVTLAMKPGRVLATEQIVGVQRLVAASVPDIVAADVTVLDQHGVALTRVADEAGTASATSQLDSKRSTEDYLLRKITQVLDRTFGPGEAIASVDVALNMDQSKVTTEEVLPAKAGAQEGSPAGVVIRERQTTRESGAAAGDKTAAAGGVTTIESDYQVGRRVEQVVTGAGTLRRMTVAVVVKQALSETQIEKLKEVLGLAVGFNSQRGDAIVVQTMETLARSSGMAPPAVTVEGAAGVGEELRATATPDGQPAHAQGQAPAPWQDIWVFAAMFGAAAVLGAAYFLLGSAKRLERKRLQ
ncbi:MAG TPA: flagellar basal-body MS-ring/collar protein FliF, partial [Noviherbaspirillum sp.]|nr:flagellar basal-body MS-ring/collar protein FliF [Noviherbaspirillum sp.]